MQAEVNLRVSLSGVGRAAAAFGSVSCCLCCVVFVGWIQQVGFLVRLVLPFLRDMKGNDGLALTMKSKASDFSDVLGIPLLE